VSSARSATHVAAELVSLSNCHGLARRARVGFTPADRWLVYATGGLGGGWTGKVEYLHMDLGSVSGTFMSATTFPLRGTFVATSRVTDEIMRVGVNYRFGCTIDTHAVDARRALVALHSSRCLGGPMRLPLARLCRPTRARVWPLSGVLRSCSERTGRDQGGPQSAEPTRHKRARIAKPGGRRSPQAGAPISLTQACYHDELT
jgi:hypothetical protein